jgi:hypothetical protein
MTDQSSDLEPESDQLVPAADAQSELFSHNFWLCGSGCCSGLTLPKHPEPEFRKGAGIPDSGTGTGIP